MNSRSTCWLVLTWTVMQCKLHFCYAILSFLYNIGSSRQQMVSTRSQRNAQLFDGSTWARVSDERFAHDLGSICLRYHDLRSVGVFNTIVVQFAKRMHQKYGDEVTVNLVKRRVVRLKRRYNAFKKFLDLPGVDFNPYNKRVTVNEFYWANFEPRRRVGSNNIVHLMWIILFLLLKQRITYVIIVICIRDQEPNKWKHFRVEGFPPYLDCISVFDHKHAAEITFDTQSMDTLHIPPQLFFRMYPDLAPPGILDDLDIGRPIMGEPDLAGHVNNGQIHADAESSVDSY